jgi:hypothetical protein
MKAKEVCLLSPSFHVRTLLDYTLHIYIECSGTDFPVGVECTLRDCSSVEVAQAP